jgi:hypothetical protein
MRELKIVGSQFYSCEIVFTFFEDGTYIRNSIPEKWRWRMTAGGLLYQPNNYDGWRKFFDEVDDMIKISNIVSEWQQELEFMDAVDSVLDQESDPNNI